MPIFISKQILVSDGKAPYSYSWSSDNGCATFTQPSGITMGNIQTGITFTSESCLTSSTITLSVTDADGCSTTDTITINNPCTTLALNAIGAGDNFVYSVTAASSNCSSVQFNWNFDNSVFTVVGQSDSSFSSQLTLKLKEGQSVYPNTTPVSVTATDCRGCTETATTQAAICTPTAPDIEVNLYPVTVFGVEVFSMTQDATIPALTGCAGITTDYTTFNVSYDPPLSISQLTPSNTIGSTGDFTKFNASAPLSLADDGLVHVAKYSMRTTDGRQSTQGNIIVRLHPSQSTTKTIFAADKTHTLACTAQPGDVVDIPIDYAVSPGAVVDWSTWQLVQPPVPKSGTIVLSTNISGDRVIKYTVPSPVAEDSFAWTVADTNGNYAESTVFTILGCALPPTAVDDTITVGCNSSTTFNLLTNDIGNAAPLDIASISIITPPTKIGLTVNTNGTVSVSTTGVTEATSDTFTYTVKDVNGEVSNIATVTVNIPCAGVDSFVSLCN